MSYELHASVERREGFALAALVRPAIEELVTLRYLNLLGTQDATEYLAAKIKQDYISAFVAQQRFEGATPWGGNIRLPQDEDLAASDHEAMAAMVKLGERHGWRVTGRRGRKRCYGPAMALMADKVGEREFYDYIYAAASRFVHFSPTELLRRG
jgi:hypothetical protein